MIDQKIEKDGKFTQPLLIPFKCVVCNGFGTVSNQKHTCHACRGKGYIVIEKEKRE